MVGAKPDSSRKITSRVPTSASIRKSASPPAGPGRPAEGRGRPCAGGCRGCVSAEIPRGAAARSATPPIHARTSRSVASQSHSSGAVQVTPASAEASSNTPSACRSSSVIWAGRPGRGASARASNPPQVKRCTASRTVTGLHSSRSATCDTVKPRPSSRMHSNRRRSLRDRSRPASRRRTSACCSDVNSTVRIFGIITTSRQGSYPNRELTSPRPLRTCPADHVTTPLSCR